MNTQNINELLATLAVTAMNKSSLHINLRGWVNALGLYIQEASIGGMTRLQAGGSLQGYIDAWHENGEWKIKKFDEITWRRRFARLVEPTAEIANFLLLISDSMGNVDLAAMESLTHAIYSFQATGIWAGIPKPSQRVMDTRLNELVRNAEMQDHSILLNDISTFEKRVKEDPKDFSSCSLLATMYLRDNRYKEMENALKMAIHREDSASVSSWVQHEILGKLYLAALSVSVRGKGTAISGRYFPSTVIVEALGYSTSQLQEWSMVNLKAALDSYKRQSGTKDNALHIRQFEFALKAAENPTNETFDEYDLAYEKQRQNESN